MSEGSRKQTTVGASPCAACKLLRRRCTQGCTFAPYFPADEPHKFANVHKVFGASNINKMLQELPMHERSDAVCSMVYEANARVRDPVYGCAGAISSLRHQVDSLQAQLALAHAEMIHLRMHFTTTTSSPLNGENTIDEAHWLSPKKMGAHSRALLAMDMVVDQTNMGEPLWSW